VIPADRIRQYVEDLARRLADIEIALTELRRQIESARLLAEGLAAAMGEP
jgi:broad specificity phosphatase PhoE